MLQLWRKRMNHSQDSNQVGKEVPSRRFVGLRIKLVSGGISVGKHRHFVTRDRLSTREKT